MEFFPAADRSGGRSNIEPTCPGVSERVRHRVSMGMNGIGYDLNRKSSRSSTTLFTLEQTKKIEEIENKKKIYKK